MTCEGCGHELHVGDWPFCRGDAAAHSRASLAVRPDAIDFWAENAWPEPRHFTSQQAYEQALAADGMELRPHHVPGGKLANWATMDPYTLENGRILAERQAHTKASDVPEATLETFSGFTVRTVGTFSVKADA